MARFSLYISIVLIACICVNSIVLSDISAKVNSNILSDSPSPIKSNSLTEWISNLPEISRIVLSQSLHSANFSNEPFYIQNLVMLIDNPELSIKRMKTLTNTFAKHLIPFIDQQINFFTIGFHSVDDAINQKFNERVLTIVSNIYFAKLMCFKNNDCFYSYLDRVAANLLKNDCVNDYIENHSRADTMKIMDHFNAFEQNEFYTNFFHAVEIAYDEAYMNAQLNSTFANINSVSIPMFFNLCRIDYYSHFVGKTMKHIISDISNLRSLNNVLDEIIAAS